MCRGDILGRQLRSETISGYVAVRQKGDFFANDIEKQLYIKALEDTANRHLARLCGYILANSEVFIFLECENLQKLMQSLNSSYIRRRNSAAKKSKEQTERGSIARYEVREIEPFEIDSVLAYIKKSGGTIFMQTSLKLALNEKIELKKFKPKKRINMKIEALDTELHTKLEYHAEGVPDTPFAQVVTTEMWDIAKNLPIVFTNDVVPTMVALLGKDNNLMINDEFAGRIPARLSNYPFMLAKVEDKVVLCIDSEAKQLKGKGEKLFEKDGKYTEFTNGIIEAMQNYSIEEERTNLAIQEIKKAGLLINKDLSVTIDGKKITLIKGFSIVSRKKLNELDDITLASFARRGLLEVIYAHLYSINNLELLTNRILQHEADKANADK